MEILSDFPLSEQDLSLIKAEVDRALVERNARSKSGTGNFVESVKVTKSEDGEEFVLEIEFGQRIKRIRRITGYLSPQDRWNDAKLAELRDRRPHRW